MKHCLLFAGYLLLAFVGSPAKAVERSSSAIHFETPVLDFDEAQNQAYLSESFVLQRDSQTLTGREAIIYLNQKTAQAQGNLVFDDPALVVHGSSLTVFSDSETFRWRHGLRGEFKNSPWRFQALEMEGTTKLYHVTRVRFTSCDRDHPDYYVWALRGKIRPGQSASFNHAVFYIEDIPFWYWPYYAKALGDKPRPTVYMEPGQDGHNGKTLNTIIAYPIADQFYGRLRLDWLQKIGVGWGPELLYKENDSRKGIVSFYTIKEPSGLSQWDARGDGYYQMFPWASLQGTFRYQRDPNFSQLYAQSLSKQNPEFVSPDLKSSVATNLRFGPLQGRAFYSDTWGFNQQEGYFKSVDQILPGFEGIVNPWKLGPLPFYFNANILAQLRRTRSAPVHGVPFKRWEDFGNARLALPWRLPFVSFIGGSFGTFLGMNYVSKESKTDLKSTKQASYGGDAALNLSPSALFNLNMVYTRTLRSEKDSFRQDTKALDRGVNAETISGFLLSSLPFYTSIMANATYSLPTKPPRNIQIAWTERLSPVFASLTTALPTRTNFTFSTNYNVFYRQGTHNIGASQSVLAYTATTNFVWDNHQENRLLPTFMLNGPLKPLFSDIRFTWMSEYLARTQVLSQHKFTHRPFYQELVLVPNLHDFFITLTFRKRKDVREFYFTIRLKLSAESERKTRVQLGETEFRPWRQNYYNPQSYQPPVVK